MPLTQAEYLRRRGEIQAAFDGTSTAATSQFSATQSAAELRCEAVLEQASRDFKAALGELEALKPAAEFWAGAA